jgi:hypothetical protein
MGNFVASQGCSILACSSFHGTAGIKHDDGKRLQFEIASLRYRFTDYGLRDRQCKLRHESLHAFEVINEFVYGNPEAASRTNETS